MHMHDIKNIVAIRRISKMRIKTYHQTYKWFQKKAEQHCSEVSYARIKDSSGENMALATLNRDIVLTALEQAKNCERRAMELEEHNLVTLRVKNG